MRHLCGTCGTALRQHGPCVVCGARRPSPPIPTPSEELLILGVRCTFPCRACGFDSPLDQLDLSGSAVCLKCGLHQAFPASAWEQVVSELHAVADLAGPDPEGAERDPVWSIAPSGYEQLGVTESVRAVHAGPLTVHAGPGHPLCEACEKPVSVLSKGKGELATHCKSCGAEASYSSPAADLSPSLLGVIGPEHRSDQLDARMESSKFHCGGCGGPLPVDGLGRLVRCEFCQVVSRIPIAALQGLAAPPPPDVWWFVFQGPSDTRVGLLLERSDDALTLEDPEYAPFSKPRAAFRFFGTTVALVIGTLIAFALFALRAML